MNLTVRLQGGLGNQLFQFAAAYALINRSKSRGNLLIDTSCYKKSDEIDLLKILDQSHYIIGEDIRRSFYERLCSRIHWLDYTYKKKYFVEKKLTYDERINEHNNIKGLIGYWQSEKYFIKFASEIIRIYKVAFSLDNKINSNVCSIHIRGGDYLASGIHVAIGENYYSKAVQYAKIKGLNKFKIFTNDVDYSRHIIDTLDIDYTFSESNAHSSIDALAEMSKCGHNIIANSSFSWWASYLNQNEDKIVIAPRQWYENTDSDLNKSSQITKVL